MQTRCLFEIVFYSCMLAWGGAIVADMHHRSSISPAVSVPISCAAGIVNPEYKYMGCSQAIAQNAGKTLVASGQIPGQAYFSSPESSMEGLDSLCPVSIKGIQPAQSVKAGSDSARYDLPNLTESKLSETEPL